MRDIKTTISLILLALLASSTLLPACDSKAKETEEDNDKEKKKSKKDKKKSKDEKEDGDATEAASNASGEAVKPPEGPSKKVPWAATDFDNDVPANDTFQTGSKACNIMLNACMACRDRLDGVDQQLWSRSVRECFELKEAVLALDEAKRDASCSSAVTAMKAADDCATASFGAKAIVTK